MHSDDESLIGLDVAEIDGLSEHLTDSQLRDLGSHEGWQNAADIYDAPLAGDALSPSVPLDDYYKNELMPNLHSLLTNRIEAQIDTHVHYLADSDNPKELLTDKTLEHWAMTYMFKGEDLDVRDSTSDLENAIFDPIRDTEQFQTLLQSLQNLNDLNSPMSEEINQLLAQHGAISYEAGQSLSQEQQQTISREVLSVVNRYNEPYQIEVVLDKDIELSVADAVRLAQISEYAQRFSVTYQQAFGTLLERENQSGRLSDKMMNFIIENQHDMPKFTIMQTEPANDWLEKTNFFHENDEQWPMDYLAPGEWGLVYNNPEPIAKFWHKDTPEINQGQHAEPETRQDGITPWGDYYRELAHVAYHAIDLTHVPEYLVDSEYQHQHLDPIRLNPFGEHNAFSPNNTGSNPDGQPQFYYVWRVYRARSHHIEFILSKIVA